MLLVVAADPAKLQTAHAHSTVRSDHTISPSGLAPAQRRAAGETRPRFREQGSAAMPCFPSQKPGAFVARMADIPPPPLATDLSSRDHHILPRPTPPCRRPQLNMRFLLSMRAIAPRARSPSPHASIFHVLRICFRTAGRGALLLWYVCLFLVFLLNFDPSERKDWLRSRYCIRRRAKSGRDRLCCYEARLSRGGGG